MINTRHLFLSRLTLLVIAQASSLMTTSIINSSIVTSDKERRCQGNNDRSLTNDYTLI